MASSFFLNSRIYDGRTIVSFDDYRPWSSYTAEGGVGADYPEYSRQILNLKKGDIEAVQFFFDRVNPELGDDFAIAIVPSHDPTNFAGGLKKLASKIANVGDRSDASGCLVRHTKTEKLTSGGNRTVDVHTASINVANDWLIIDRNVLLLDDVTSTGNSLVACRQLLENSGARLVQCVALGKNPLNR
jgi:hypothetical protein